MSVTKKHVSLTPFYTFTLADTNHVFRVLMGAPSNHQSEPSDPSTNILLTQGVLSSASHAESVVSLDALKDPALTGEEPVSPEDAEADKFQDKLEKEIESDLGKNTASLMGRGLHSSTSLRGISISCH
jgi:hypothetical protein